MVGSVAQGERPGAAVRASTSTRGSSAWPRGVVAGVVERVLLAVAQRLEGVVDAPEGDVEAVVDQRVGFVATDALEQPERAIELAELVERARDPLDAAEGERAVWDAQAHVNGTGRRSA